MKRLKKLQSNNGSFQKDKANFYLAEAYFAKGDFQAALNSYNKINTENKEVGTQTLYGKAYCYYNLKDYANAIFYFNQYIMQPGATHFIDAKLRLADSHYGTKNFERASSIYNEVFRSAGKLNSDYELYQFGQALFYANQPGDAINRFEETAITFSALALC